MIRPAVERDLPVLRDLERAAGEGFRDIGMAAVADDEPPAVETLRGYLAAGRRGSPSRTAAWPPT